MPAKWRPGNAVVNRAALVIDRSNDNRFIIGRAHALACNVDHDEWITPGEEYVRLVDLMERTPEDIRTRSTRCPLLTANRAKR